MVSDIEVVRFGSFEVGCMRAILIFSSEEGISNQQNEIYCSNSQISLK
jgi:hypothetical protein